MWKHIAANGLTFLIVALFLAGGVILWGMNEYSAEGPLDQAICLNVRDGSNMRRVSEQLSEQGAIKSPAIFRMGSDYSERTSQLKAGNFLVPERASMEDIVGIVTGTGRSTCGTEVVYRIGVVRNVVQIRELDPATNRYVDLAEFEMAGDNVPAVYGTVRDESDTQYRVVLAEGVTSWQAMTALNGIDVLTGEIPGAGLGQSGGWFAAGNARAGLDSGVHRREGNRWPRRGGHGCQRVRKSPSPRDAIADGSDGDLRHHQWRGYSGARFAPK